MDVNEFKVAPLVAGHVDECLRLSIEAGWNQTEADWRFHLENGAGTAILSDSGAVVATGVTLPAMQDLEWIAMILVDPEFRRRGLGRRIMETLLSASPATNFALDATEFGKGLYDHFGFRPLEEVIRYREFRGHELSLPGESGSGPVNPRLDPIARKLSRRTDVTEWTFASGIALARTGSTAVHIGPIIADAEREAEALVRRIRDVSSGDILIDVTARAGTFCRRLERIGFKRERSFVRMSLGRAFLVAPGTFAIAGPEFG